MSGGEALSRPTATGLSKGQPETQPLTPAPAPTPPLAFRTSLHVTVPCFPHLRKDDSSTNGQEGQRGVTLDPGREEANDKGHIPLECWVCWNDPWDFPSIQKGEQRLQMEDREGQGERNEEGQGFAPPAFTVTLAGSWTDGGRGRGTNGCPSCQKSHTKSLSICPTWQLKLQPPSVVLDQ